MKSLDCAVGGKTARACDSCVKRRAHWYCPADDAFLCHACDGLVHSANPLSRKHKRVLLPSANVGKNLHASSPLPSHQATWHKGFTRKARTPRGGKKNRFHELVPEITTYDQAESYEEEGQLIFEVPVRNLMVEKQCLNKSLETVSFKNRNEEEDNNAESCLNSLFPTDLELAQFTADVETLLGEGMEREYHPMKELGFNELSKIEKEEVDVATREVCDLVEADDETSQFKISFDCGSSQKMMVEEEKDNKEDVMEVRVNEMSGRIKEEKKLKKEKALSLRLDYESVISSWGGLEIPWTASEPSEIDLDMGQNGTEAHHHNNFNALGLLHKREAGDGEREAKVSRYREKRRTRLLSKKIRYEVRKLNAKKRPRMK